MHLFTWMQYTLQPCCEKSSICSIGVKLNGAKEVLGLWIGENESSKYWLSVLTEIRNRGTEDILIISIYNLKGFSESIEGYSHLL